MAQIEEEDLKNYNLKRFDCEDPFLMEIFALKVERKSRFFGKPTKFCQKANGNPTKSVQNQGKYGIFACSD